MRFDSIGSDTIRQGDFKPGDEVEAHIKKDGSTSIIKHAKQTVRPQAGANRLQHNLEEAREGRLDESTQRKQNPNRGDQGVEIGTGITSTSGIEADSNSTPLKKR